MWLCITHYLHCAKIIATFVFQYHLLPHLLERFETCWKNFDIFGYELHRVVNFQQSFGSEAVCTIYLCLCNLRFMYLLWWTFTMYSFMVTVTNFRLLFVVVVTLVIPTGICCVSSTVWLSLWCVRDRCLRPWLWTRNWTILCTGEIFQIVNFLYMFLFLSSFEKFHGRLC